MGIIHQIRRIVPLHELVTEPDGEHRDDGEHDGERDDVLPGDERLQTTAYVRRQLRKAAGASLLAGERRGRGPLVVERRCRHAFKREGRRPGDLLPS